MGFAERLRAEWPSLERTVPGRVGFAAWDLDEREAVTCGADRVVRAASTIKILIMITALRQVGNGLRQLDEERELPEVPLRAGGFGVVRELTSVHRLSLADLITLMIVVSDNAATNAVIDAVGFDAIAECARDLGCTATRVERRLMDERAMGSNVTTAADQARILDRLATGRALPEKMTRYALEVLSRQQIRDRLPAHLPVESSCWNKTGELPGARYDVALISNGRARAVVAVLVDELTDEVSAAGARGGPACPALAELGRAVYRCLDQNRRE